MIKERDITASSLDDLVLRHLSHLTQGEADSEVSLNDLIVAAVASTSLGHLEAKEVRRLITEATRNLKRQGLCHSPRRGYRALTVEGVQASSPQPQHPLEEEIPVMSASAGIAYVPVTFKPPSEEHDRNLIKLKSESALCFGYHRKVSECGGCSIQEVCRARQAEILSEIGGRLDKEHRMNAKFERLRTAIGSGGDERNQAILDLIELVDGSRNPLGAREVIVCPAYTFCWVCDDVIQPGEKSLWRPNYGASHLTCNP